MNLLSIEKLKKNYGDRTIFENVTFGLNEGDKAAIIGINGSGKSTLLKIIAGLEESDGGNVAVNKTCIINYLAQLPDVLPQVSVIDYIFKSDTPTMRLIKRYEQLCHTDSPELHKIMSELDSKNAWGYEYSVKSVLGELGIHDYTIKMGELSGGMAKKVSLAQALIDEGNLLILDEPTNHLDIDTVEWLQNHLESTKKAVLLVTHDRYFLDSVCNLIFEIDEGKFTRYDGNYSFYLEKKAETEAHEQRRQERLSNILRNELVWLRRSPKARTTKQKARIDRAAVIQDSIVHKTERDLELKTLGRRLGGKIIDLKDVSKAYGDKVLFRNFSYSFKKGEKLGIAGANGSGKSTFLRVLTGEEQPDNGIVDIGINTFFGVFDQHSKELDPEMKVIQYIEETAKNIKLDNGLTLSATLMLERFLFPKDSHYRPIGKLSGGEKRRLHLVNELIKNPNFIILDEPTNDLDIQTLSVLEDFLEDFGGCAVVVSHDRYFMDRVCDTMFIFKGDGIFEHFPGSYSNWMESRNVVKEKSSEKKESPKQEQEKKRKLTYAEKKEYEGIEAEIAVLEGELADLSAELEQGGSDYSRLTDLQAKIEAKEMELLEKMERWEYLSGLE
ncbi:ABC-F family ATP-binding cassette domain-containing protein [Geovibrio sp. ADMFC3]